jgi:hypothetical protein
MLDVLVALLLLAIALAGACATLIQTMRASHAALLSTRAVDLAADLTEDLQAAATDAQALAVLASWRARVPAVLPVAGLGPEGFITLARVLPREGEAPPAAPPHLYTVSLRWHGPSPGELREIDLPVPAAAPGLAP